MELGFFFRGMEHLWLFPLKNATKPFIDYQIFKFIDNNFAIGLDECARRVLEYLEDSVPWSFLPRNDPPLSVRLLRFRLKNSTDPTETETYLEILRELNPQNSQDRVFSWEKHGKMLFRRKNSFSNPCDGDPHRASCDLVPALKRTILSIYVKFVKLST